jgi:hypothetical protein
MVEQISNHDGTNVAWLTQLRWKRQHQGKHPHRTKVVAAGADSNGKRLSGAV